MKNKPTHKRSINGGFMKKINSFLFVFVSLLALSSQTLFAQDSKIISPSEKDINTCYIKPYSAERRMTIIRNGSAMPPMVMKDAVSINEKNGEKFLVRVQTIDAMNFVDTSINVYKNFKPVYHSGHNKSGDLILFFGDGVVNGKKHFSINDSTALIDTKMPLPYFDSNLYDLVVTSLALEKGLKAKIPTYIFEDSGLSWFEIFVSGEEEITLTNGTKVLAWVVENINSNKKAQMWISKKDHELVKTHFKVTPPNDPNASPMIEIVTEKI